MLTWVRILSLTLAIKGKIARLVGLAKTPYPTVPESLCLSPSQRHIHEYTAHQPQCSWRIGNYINAEEWQKIARQKLMELTGYTADRPQSISQNTHKSRLGRNITKTSTYLNTWHQNNIPVHLIYDSSKSGPKPVMICLQGTNSGIHLSWGEVRMPADPERITRGAANALQAAKRGYVAVAIEQSCFGERREQHMGNNQTDPCITAANHALLMGKTLLGERMSDVSTVIDWLETEDHGLELDLECLHIMGTSSGGTTGFFSMAADIRISAGLIGGCIGYYRNTIGKRADSSGQNVIPDILNWFEMDDIIGLSAPRPLLLFSGTDDHIWPYSETKKVADSAHAVYDAMNATDNLRTVPAIGGHSYHPHIAWPAFEKLLEDCRLNKPTRFHSDI